MGAFAFLEPHNCLNDLFWREADDQPICDVGLVLIHDWTRNLST
jgi:hypothetical protein